MTTLRLNGGRELKRKQQRSAYFSPLRVYVDRGWRSFAGDGELRVKEPPPVQRVMLTLQMFQQRHNSLQPALLPTDRILLRWGESGGTGLPNPEAEIRETHYDPLPPDLQERVDEIVTDSPWETLVRKWYRTTLTGKELAEQMGIARSQLYVDWRSSLWYYRGRFEATGLHE